MSDGLVKLRPRWCGNCMTRIGQTDTRAMSTSEGGVTEMSSGYELPKTLAERNEGLTDFWARGYDYGLETALTILRDIREGHADFQAVAAALCAPQEPTNPIPGGERHQTHQEKPL